MKLAYYIFGMLLATTPIYTVNVGVALAKKAGVASLKGVLSPLNPLVAAKKVGLGVVGLGLLKKKLKGKDEECEVYYEDETTPHCSTSYEQRCVEEYNEECSTDYSEECSTEYRNECSTEYSKECHDEYKEECKTDYSQECHEEYQQHRSTEYVNNCNVEYVNQCSTEYDQECHTVEEQVCKEVPKCHTTNKQHCTVEYDEYCEEESKLRGLKGKLFSSKFKRSIQEESESLESNVNYLDDNIDEHDLAADSERQRRFAGSGLGLGHGLAKLGTVGLAKKVGLAKVAKVGGLFALKKKFGKD